MSKQITIPMTIHTSTINGKVTTWVTYDLSGLTEAQREELFRVRPDLRPK